MNKNGLIYAVLGTVVMLFAGLIYSWSVLSRPIAAEFSNWSNATLSFTFTLCMSFFCLGGLLAGLSAKRYGIRLNFILSAVSFLIGFLISANSYSPTTLYIGYGIIAGLASGLVYNTIMSTITGYFPDKPGFISGILLMGFGLGSFIIGKVYQQIISLNYNWRFIFIFLGVTLFIILIVCSFIIKAPPKNIKKETFNEEDKNQIHPSKMLKTQSFWLFFIWAVLSSTCGLAIISQASGIISEVYPTIHETSISTIVGLISIFNGIGRIFFGKMFDKIGRFHTMLLNGSLFLFAILLMIISLNTNQIILLITSFIFTGLSYGGIPTTNSAFTASFYGQKYYSVNFSLTNMNILLASFGGTIAGKLYDLSNSYLWVTYSMFALVILSILISTQIKKS